MHLSIVALHPTSAKSACKILPCAAGAMRSVPLFDATSPQTLRDRRKFNPHRIHLIICDFRSALDYSHRVHMQMLKIARTATCLE